MPTNPLHGANHHKRPARTHDMVQCNEPSATRNVTRTMTSVAATDCQDENHADACDQVPTKKTKANTSINGGARRKQNEDAWAGDNPARKPAATVRPDRERPGNTEIPWASPTHATVRHVSAGRLPWEGTSSRRGVASSIAALASIIPPSAQS